MWHNHQRGGIASRREQRQTDPSLPLPVTLSGLGAAIQAASLSWADAFEMADIALGRD